MRNRLLYLFCFLVWTTDLLAQQHAFRNISTDDGLPTSECYDVMQDHKGYIWVSSNAGIARYNGKTFKTFTTKDGLSDNTVFKTFEDNQGRIFYIDVTAKIGYIYNDSVHVAPVADTLSKLMRMGKLFIYKLSDYDAEHLLISSQNGFYTLDKKTLSRLERLPAAAGDDIVVRTIDHKTYVACYEPDPDPSYKGINTLYILQPTGSFRTGTNIGMAGSTSLRTAALDDGTTLCSFSESLSHIKADGSMEIRRFPALITSLEIDRVGGTWVSVLNNGVYYYPQLSRKSLNDTAQLQHLMVSESPSDVLMDKDGGIWMSTLYNGLYYCPNLGIINFSNVNILNSKLYGLSHAYSSILANGLTNRFFIFKSKNNFHYMDLPQKEKIQGGLSYLVAGDRVYVAGYHASYILGPDFQLEKLLAYEGNTSTAAYDFAMDRRGRLFGLHYAWFMRMENDVIYKEAELPSRGRDVASDSSGRIYVATNKGVFIYENRQFIPTGVTIKVHKLRAGPSGTMWACSDGNGVLQLRGTEVIKKYTEADGLPSGICYDILFHDGNYWVGTNKGLCCLNIAAPAQSYTLKKENGLPSNEVLKLDQLNGELYMGTSKGLCIADFSALKPDRSAPAIYISGIRCNDSAVQQQHDFSYDQNNFRFNAEGLSYQNMNDMRYKYRLQGFDTTWNTDKSTEISYNNLAPGAYTFEIKAVNANGLSSPFPARYSFVIEKPFWKRVWFLLILLLVLIECIYLFMSWRVRVIKKKELKKTEYNKMLAEYHMSALRAQMNPHFIFNAINSIQHYILVNEKQYAYDYLTKFSKLIRRVLANSQQSTSTLKKELELLELYMQIEQLRFKNRFEFEIRYDDDFPLEEIEIPIMLLQPYVENAIWHGIMNLPETTKGRIIIVLQMEGDTVKITIEDNGVGRERAAQLKSTGTHISVGMSLSRDRLEILKIIGSGGMIMVTDLQDENGPSGTRVELFIK